MRSPSSTISASSILTIRTIVFLVQTAACRTSTFTSSSSSLLTDERALGYLSSNVGGRGGQKLRCSITDGPTFYKASLRLQRAGRSGNKRALCVAPNALLASAVVLLRAL